MRKAYLLLVYTFVALLIALPGPVFADLKVQVAKESELPFELSPQNPINSPGDPNNSINNSSNSASNPDNSLSNPENSSSKAENGMTGNRRLLFEQDGVYYFIGYFVLNENRLINFFLPMETGCSMRLQGLMPCLDQRMGSSAGRWQPPITKRF
jgi:hypothetical protein